jgi:pimeloyl-ACP methyl ester carboxylesterase
MQLVIDGILTHYRVLGLESAPSILILHGWARSSADWLPTAQTLSKKYKVILLDLPKKDLDTFASAGFVASFIKKLDLKNTLVLGHSFGGKIAIVLAATHPSLVSKLILVSPSGIEKKSPGVLIQNRLGKIAKLLPMPAPLKSTLRAKLASRDYKSAGVLQKTLVAIVNQNVSQFARKITQPTKIIWGECDKEVPVKWSKVLTGLIKNSEVRIVWKAGHHPHLESPEKFQRILKEVL